MPSAKSTSIASALCALVMTGAVAGALVSATAATAAAQDLPRRAQLGVALEAGDGGAKIRAVTPGATAALAGLAPGDVITAVNGETTPNQQAVVALAQRLQAGAPVRFAYRRNGAASEARATATPRPLETYTGATARYGAVAFRNGRLRDILVTPTGAPANHPVVFLIQGYVCATMEGPTPEHPYRAFAQGLAERGIATYRIEKPGIGDSDGGPNCIDTDFDTELDAFRAGLKTLIDTYRIAPSRIVLMGHSMGGVQAPLLAAERQNLKGVAVMGTVARNWHDYMIELFRLQGFFSANEDPVEGEVIAEEMRPLLDRIFTENVPLRQIANDEPRHADLMRRMMAWDGNSQLLMRDVSFWRGVGQQRMTRAFQRANAPVLAMYGEADFAAIDDRDHRLIADVVNFYRPGQGTYVQLAKTGHGFGLEGARAEARAANEANNRPMNFAATYNPDVHRVLADWVLGLK